MEGRCHSNKMWMTRQDIASCRRSAITPSASPVRPSWRPMATIAPLFHPHRIHRTHAYVRKGLQRRDLTSKTHDNSHAQGTEMGGQVAPPSVGGQLCGNQQWWGHCESATASTSSLCTPERYARPTQSEVEGRLKKPKN